MKTSAESIATLFPAPNPPPTDTPAIPAYLQDTYWWAYLHPNAVRLFEREWLVNLILWGNFSRLRDWALDVLGGKIDHPVLQIACVYGNFTQRIAALLGEHGKLDVVDVAPIQLANLRRKLPADQRIRLHHQDSSALHFPDASFDSTLLFFLLHEQPASIRRATLSEAMRVTRPGGKIVIVDYHQPKPGNPLRYIMQGVLRTLEPFALDLWQQEIAAYLPSGVPVSSLVKTTCFGNLYQKIVITV
ncbi:MAG: methyltransferase domain-containing protein [Dechloromonas sp.]|nr:methyltransferase domain-containing protein [Dechloromonas sp.]